MPNTPLPLHPISFPSLPSPLHSLCHPRHILLPVPVTHCPRPSSHPNQPLANAHSTLVAMLSCLVVLFAPPYTPPPHHSFDLLSTLPCVLPAVLRTSLPMPCPRGAHTLTHLIEQLPCLLQKLLPRIAHLFSLPQVARSLATPHPTHSHTLLLV